jgi:hypothetical protein
MENKSSKVFYVYRYINVCVSGMLYFDTDCGVGGCKCKHLCFYWKVVFHLILIVSTKVKLALSTSYVGNRGTAPLLHNVGTRSS